MGFIPVTNRIPGSAGGASQGGGEGLEHTLVHTIEEDQLTALRGTPQVIIPTAVGRLIVVKAAVFWTEFSSPDYAVPTSANLRLYYGTATSRSIIDQSLDLLETPSSQQAHIHYARSDVEFAFSSSSQPVRARLNGGTGEITVNVGAARGALYIRVVYDLLDPPA